MAQTGGDEEDNRILLAVLGAERLKLEAKLAREKAERPWVVAGVIASVIVFALGVYLMYIGGKMIGILK
jgi:hypothetical protein